MKELEKDLEVIDLNEDELHGNGDDDNFLTQLESFAARPVSPLPSFTRSSAWSAFQQASQAALGDVNKFVEDVHSARKTLLSRHEGSEEEAEPQGKDGGGAPLSDSDQAEAQRIQEEAAKIFESIKKSKEFLAFGHAEGTEDAGEAQGAVGEEAHGEGKSGAEEGKSGPLAEGGGKEAAAAAPQGEELVIDEMQTAERIEEAQKEREAMNEVLMAKAQRLEHQISPTTCRCVLAAVSLLFPAVYCSLTRFLFVTSIGRKKCC